MGVGISIHAPHTGRDHPYHAEYRPIDYFNPRAPYGARRNTPNNSPQEAEISIHAPHTGRDSIAAMQKELDELNFNPRAPYGARRLHHSTSN